MQESLNTQENRATLALVTGANRGIGLEVVQQLAEAGMTVILGSRDLQKGEAAAGPLVKAGLAVLPLPLDVTDPASINRLAQTIEQRFGYLDILINYAGILHDTWQTASNADLDQVQQALATNTLGPWRMVQAFLPLLRQSQHGRIVNVSSGAGSLDEHGGGHPGLQHVVNEKWRDENWHHWQR